MKRLSNWVVLGLLLVSLVIAGCAGITPNQMAPSKADNGKTSESHSQNEYKEFDQKLEWN